MPPSDVVYDYIVFKGSDVKDLVILEAPKDRQSAQVPNDPAIIDVSPGPLLARNCVKQFIVDAMHFLSLLHLL